MQDRWKVEIKASPDKVWAYVGDLKKHSEWSPKTYRANWLSGAPDAVGSRFESFGWLPGKSENRMEGEVTENNPLRRYAVKSWGEKKNETFVNTFVLASIGDTTTVEKIQDAPEPTGFMKIGWPILNAVFVHGAQQKGLDMLKARVEGSA